LAGNYLIALGVLLLLSLRPIGFTFNLGGVLLIWFGVQVRERHEGFRKASLWLLGLCLAAGLLVLAWATVAGTERITVTFLQEHAAPSRDWYTPPPFRRWLFLPCPSGGSGRIRTGIHPRQIQRP
jgi:hypothetical protein